VEGAANCFVGGTCRSIHIECLNKNIKALGVIESKWDPIRKKLARRLLEEQDKVLRSYFAQKGGQKGKRRDMERPQGREHVRLDVYVYCGHGRIVNKFPES
jgi:hypothetical protein